MEVDPESVPVPVTAPEFSARIRLNVNEVVEVVPVPLQVPEIVVFGPLESPPHAL